MPYYPTRKLTILALDPSVKDGKKILRTQIEIPNEQLDAGPKGHRVHVIDYDSTNNVLYPAAPVHKDFNRNDAPPLDPFETVEDEDLINDRAFHAWMTYGIVMKVLARFEFALGRRIGWSFSGHQIQVAPHAFSDANAFYSDRAEALFFGYFPSLDKSRKIFSCLSHEVVAHETTHALLDGLRERYTDPSSPQQAGFHEGFSDIVALLSIFSEQPVVAKMVDMGMPDISAKKIKRSALSPETLKKSALLGLANEMGAELSGIHGQALRRSVQLPPKQDYLTSGECDEPHACGEVLVAAVINAYLEVWIQRLEAIGNESTLDRNRAAEEGAEIADRLMTMCIRAIDYCPPTDLQFSDFLSAIVTADWELNPKDEKYKIRSVVIEWFAKYGIQPKSDRQEGQPGAWYPPPADQDDYKYDRTHFDPMKGDPDELFRFLWENRELFKINEQAYTRVLSVRPCVRFGRDGFVLRETVVEYHQQLKIAAGELAALQIRKPEGMPDETEVILYGGNAVIFDEYGHVKYNIGNAIMQAGSEPVQKKQSDRLDYLWTHGAYNKGASKMRAFARLHRMRSTDWYRSVTTVPEAKELHSHAH